jgi:hypothetical protein
VLLGVSAAVEVAMQEWTEGTRRLAALEVTAARRTVVHAVVAEIAAEVERRIGQTFTLAELAAQYGDAAAWSLDIAMRVSQQPLAHDLSIVQDAAFARVARNAIDYRR